jgi:GMP synthase (glutamine-hydrolysing)
VYCEIVPFQLADEGFARMKPKGVIFSGGPDSVTREGSPRAPQAVFDSAFPFSPSATASRRCAPRWRQVEGGHHREFGRAFVEVSKPRPLFEGFWEVGKKYPVWMSHGDRVTRLAGRFRGDRHIAQRALCHFAVTRSALLHHMFHPEVVHTPDGAKLLSNFVHKIVGLKGDWSMAAYRAEIVQKIREQVGDRQGDLRRCPAASIPPWRRC